MHSRSSIGCVFETTHPREGTETPFLAPAVKDHPRNNSSPRGDGNMASVASCTRVPRNNSSPRGDGNSPTNTDKRRYTKQLIPARGRKPYLARCWKSARETTHPREGTETMFHFPPSFYFLKQLIPARGRKLFSNLRYLASFEKQLIPARGRKPWGLTRLVLPPGNNSSPRGDGNL